MTPKIALSALAFGLIICVNGAPPTGVVDRSGGKGANYGLVYHNQPYNINGKKAASNTDPEDYHAILFPTYNTYGDYYEENGVNNFHAQDDKGTNHDGNIPEYGDKNEDTQFQYPKGNQRNDNTHLEDTSKRNNINPKAGNYGTIIRPSIKSQVLDRKVNTQEVHNNGKHEKLNEKPNYDHQVHTQITPFFGDEQYVVVVPVTVSDTKAGQINSNKGEEIQNPISHEHHHHPSYNNERINQDKTRNNDNMNRKIKKTDNNVVVRNHQSNDGKDENIYDEREKLNKCINNETHTRPSTLGNGDQIHIENNCTDSSPVHGNRNTNAVVENHSPRNTILDSEKASHGQYNKMRTVTSQNPKKGNSLWGVSPSVDDYKDKEDYTYVDGGNSNDESNESSYHYDMDVQHVEEQKYYGEKHKISIEKDKIPGQKHIKINDKDKENKITDQKDMFNDNLKVIGKKENQSDEFIKNVDHADKHKLEDRKSTVRPRQFWEVVATTDSNSVQLPGNGKIFENNDNNYEDKNKSINNCQEDKDDSCPHWKVIEVKNHTETKVNGADHKRKIYTQYHRRKYSNRESNKRHHHSDKRKEKHYNNNYNKNDKDKKDDGLIAKTKKVFDNGLQKLKNLLAITGENDGSNHQYSTIGDSKHKSWHGRSARKFRNRGYGNNYRKGDNNFNHNNKSGASNKHKYKKYYRYSNNKDNKGNGNSNNYWMKKHHHGEHKSNREDNRKSQYINKGGNIQHWQHKDEESDSRKGDGRYNNNDGKNRDWIPNSKIDTGYNNKRQYNDEDGNRRDRKHKSDHNNQNNYRNIKYHDWKQKSYHGNERRDGNLRYNNNDGRSDRREYHNTDGRYKRNDYQSDNRRYGR